jgi:hypothetical protein
MKTATERTESFENRFLKFGSTVFNGKTILNHTPALAGGAREGHKGHEGKRLVESDRFPLGVLRVLRGKALSR